MKNFLISQTWRLNSLCRRVKTAFGYVPSTRPTECSLLRQIAYQQLLPLPGPLADPDGWKVLRSVSARKDVGKRILDARCTVSELMIFIVILTDDGQKLAIAKPVGAAFCI